MSSQAAGEAPGWLHQNPREEWGLWKEWGAVPGPSWPAATPGRTPEGDVRVCGHPELKIARSPCSRGPVFACRWKYSLCWMLLSVRIHVVYGDRWIPTGATGLLGEIRTLISTCRAQREGPAPLATPAWVPGTPPGFHSSPGSSEALGLSEDSCLPRVRGHPLAPP